MCGKCLSYLVTLQVKCSVNKLSMIAMLSKMTVTVVASQRQADVAMHYGNRGY